MALVAIRLGQKGPVSAAWNKLENVITDPAAAASLRENVGLAHAYNPSGPTMAVDIDDMARAEPWLAARGININALLEAEDAVQIISGKAGRAKLLYRLPSGIAPIETLTIKDKGGVDE